MASARFFHSSPEAGLVSQFNPSDDSALAVLDFAIDVLQVEHGASLYLLGLRMI